MMTRVRCSCGREAVWYRVGTAPEEAPEHAVCFLTDDDFADDLCDACFARTVPEAERDRWKRLDPPVEG